MLPQSDPAGAGPLQPSAVDEDNSRGCSSTQPPSALHHLVRPQPAAAALTFLVGKGTALQLGPTPRNSSGDDFVLGIGQRRSLCDGRHLRSAASRQFLREQSPRAWLGPRIRGRSLQPKERHAECIVAPFVLRSVVGEDNSSSSCARASSFAAAVRSSHHIPTEYLLSSSASSPFPSRPSSRPRYLAHHVRRLEGPGHIDGLRQDVHR